MYIYIYIYIYVCMYVCMYEEGSQMPKLVDTILLTQSQK